eukprot:3288178-Pleurochrysis_carterae.AAC.1
MQGNALRIEGNAYRGATEYFAKPSRKASFVRQLWWKFQTDALLTTCVGRPSQLELDFIASLGKQQQARA